MVIGAYPKWRCVSRFAGVLVLAGAASVAGAQPAFPVKPVRVIVPFAPGGPSDFLMRIVGQKLSEAWGQQLLIDNRGGANGIVGLELVARSAPDGYIWGIATNGTHGINASLFPKMPFDTVRDFAPVTRMGYAPYLLIAHPSLPAKGIDELVKLARARPGDINWSAGGSPSQLAAELFKNTAGINVAVIPYKGNALAVTAVLSGEASLTFGSITQSMPLVKANRLRALGVGSLKRSPVIPDVPAIAESGYPGFEGGAWYGILLAGATPRAIVERIHAETVRVLNLPDVRQRLQGEAFDIPADTPDQFAGVIRAEVAKWAPLVKQAGLRAE